MLDCDGARGGGNPGAGDEARGGVAGVDLGVTPGAAADGEGTSIRDAGQIGGAGDRGAIHHGQGAAGRRAGPEHVDIAVLRDVFEVDVIAGIESLDGHPGRDRTDPNAHRALAHDAGPAADSPGNIDPAVVDVDEAAGQVAVQPVDAGRGAAGIVARTGPGDERSAVDEIAVDDRRVVVGDVQHPVIEQCAVGGDGRTSRIPQRHHAVVGETRSQPDAPDRGRNLDGSAIDRRSSVAEVGGTLVRLHEDREA